MTNTETLNEYFIWEEKSLTEHQMNYETKNVSETKDTTNDTKTNSMQIDWKDITDPKLREKMRNKAYKEANKEKIKAYAKAWQKANKDKRDAYQKAYREANKDKVTLQKKAWQEANRDYAKAWRESNRDKIKLQKKAWQEANKERLYKKQVEWKRKNKNNPQYKLSCRLRERINGAIKGNYKSGSAVKDLGCSIDELKTHLESKFQPGMTWDNWSPTGWHIDHIKPLASFDLTDRNQFLEACHYTNLQPLWARDNLSKGDRLTESQRLWRDR